MICPGLPGELLMNYANIKYFDIADGEGVRTSLFVSGCRREPENQAGLVEFVERVRAAYPAGSGKTIWCFTGDVLEELMPGGRHHTEVTDRILACLDMLVDGPFVQDLYDISLRFRGSSNQRMIDMNATRARAVREGVALCDAVELWRDDPVYSTHTM